MTVFSYGWNKGGKGGKGGELMTDENKRLRDQLETYKRICMQGATVVASLHRRILQRTPDDRNQHPADRAVLLDADLWLSEAYRIYMLDREALERDRSAGIPDKATEISDIN
jgi:hypothetical protein